MLLLNNQNFLLAFTCLLSAGIAQTISFIIKSTQTKQINLKELINTGGSISSHSAFVISLCTGIFLIEGMSTLFVGVCVFALIVLRDAVGVRQEVGFIAKALNKVTNITGKNKFNETAGHSLWQVFAGVLFGFFFCVLMFFIF